MSTDGFRHDAVLYSGDHEFVAAMAPFVRDGVEHGEPVLVAVPGPRLAALREELGGAAEDVLFADMAEIGANPGRIIPAWTQFLADHGGTGRPIRGVGEPIWAGRSAAELAECRLHEALLNLAFADAAGFQLLCPYDREGLPDEVLHGAHCTHPYVVSGGQRIASHDYPGPSEVQGLLATPLPEPEGPVSEVGFGIDDLVAVRELLCERAREAGVAPRRVEDLVLAGSELASNSVRHGGGGGRVRVWHDRDAIFCEVRDRGRLADPLAGRRRPDAGAIGGYGLWVANQLCDLVQVRTSPSGTVVRAQVRRAQRWPSRSASAATAAASASSAGRQR